MITSKDDTIHVQIGRITTWSAEVELVLEALVGSLLNDYQKFTRIVTAELSFSGVIALVLSLYRERHGEDEHFTVLKKLTSRAETAQQKRNLVVHSIWRSAGTPYVVTRIKSTAKIKHGYKTTVENWNLERFEELTEEFQSLNNELDSLLKELVVCGKAFNNPVTPPA